MSNGTISAKQREILNFIKSESLQKGYPPSVREICTAVHLKSTSSVHSHLETLEKNGYIRRDATKPRAIEILDDDFIATKQEMLSIPIVGTVAAGSPIFADENIEGYFPLPAEVLPKGEIFILKVKGDSMTKMGIYDGDSLICLKKEYAQNGEVVVAMVEDSATVKRFYREKERIRLQPENDAMEPIYVEDCRILGKVLGLLRMNIA